MGVKYLSMPSLNRILLTSNCQMAGIALGLKALLPGSQVDVASLREFDQVSQQDLNDKLNPYDLWVTAVSSPAILKMVETTKVLRIPRIVFDAYHPDIIYLRDDQGHYLKGVHGAQYHSAIAAWAYRQGLTQSQATALYRTEMFEGLGYLSRWDSALKLLKTTFAVTDLRLDDFYPAILEHAPFMHSLNHPYGAVVGQVAKQIAAKITGDRNLLHRPIERAVQDTLSSGSIWPIYPGIAEHYGLVGDYLWKFGLDKFVHGLDAFIDASFRAYDRLDPSDWRVHSRDMDLFDRVLGKEVQAA